MLHPHEHYEELCAAASTGQASESELESLKGHLPECAECRQMLEGFAQIATHAIPEVAEKRVTAKVPSGMKERFLARAYSEGLFLNKQQPVRSHWFAGSTLARWSAVAISLVLITVGVKFRVSRHDHPPDSSGAGIQVTASATTTSTARTDDSKLRLQLVAMQSERDALAAKFLTAQKALESGQQERGGVSTRLAEVESVNADLRKAQADRDSMISQLKEQMDKLQSDHEADRVATLVGENEVKDLRNKVVTQNAELNQLRQLATAADQARDLIVARNLHIVDVHDTDEDGKGRAFGRIFYTEAKSLVFYAYDLRDPRQLNAKISFYVWGEKLGATQPVKNLGIFHSDNSNEGRWVLTFDDPRVLAQINSVFVTVESSKKTVTQPSGKKVLYAFLGNTANHP